MWGIGVFFLYFLYFSKPKGPSKVIVRCSGQTPSSGLIVDRPFLNTELFLPSRPGGDAKAWSTSGEEYPKPEGIADPNWLNSSQLWYHFIHLTILLLHKQWACKLFVCFILCSLTCGGIIHPLFDWALFYTCEKATNTRKSVGKKMEKIQSTGLLLFVKTFSPFTLLSLNSWGFMLTTAPWTILQWSWLPVYYCLQLPFLTVTNQIWWKYFCFFAI